jgi:hypothetical protein
VRAALSPHGSYYQQIRIYLQDLRVQDYLEQFWDKANARLEQFYAADASGLCNACQ